MIFGMSLSAFTALHVALSLVGIASGVIVLLRPAPSPTASRLTALFLATTIGTSVSGFFFLFVAVRFGLGHALGALSLVVLAPTVLALYRYRLAAAWRWVFVAGATIALYLNAFIGVMQAFAKIGFLRTLPTNAFLSPPLIAHLLLLVLCLWLGVHALRSLEPSTAQTRPPRPRPIRPLRVADRWN